MNVYFVMSCWQWELGVGGTGLGVECSKINIAKSVFQVYCFVLDEEGPASDDEDEDECTSHREWALPNAVRRMIAGESCGAIRLCLPCSFFSVQSMDDPCTIKHPP